MRLKTTSIMKNLCFLLLFFALYQNKMVAQNNFNNTSFGQVQVDADPSIEQLLEAHTQYNLRHATTRGLRVQIIQNTDRQLVTKEKTKFLQLYPNLNIYETYEQPFFKLRVGDFENRFNAYRVYQMLKPTFNVAFIVPDMVNSSKIGEGL